MPKDPTRNVDRYKVRGGQFDDLDRTKNEGVATEDAGLARTGGAEDTNFIPGETPEAEAERKQRLIEEVHARAERRRAAKGGGGAGKSAKKSTKKSAKKSAKKASKKSGKKAAKGSKKGGGARTPASKRAGKKHATKSGKGRGRAPGAG